MKKDSLLNDYFTRYAAGPPWTLQSGNLEGIVQVVVIPAYAEKDLLFTTLASLAANSDASLEKTLILCVINNKTDAPTADKDNNRQTISLLGSLISRQAFPEFQPADDLLFAIKKISERPVRLGYIDASSHGLEISARTGGVGMARKIGMDAALRVLKSSADEPRLMISLDADTVVGPDYLASVRKAMSSGKAQTGIVSYEHNIPADETGRRAICLYEIFLRYWVLGLLYARSPYAFHSIGSTIVTKADAYLAVRGMNRREAGEDFYFLNKLAKIGPIRRIRETVVYPSARISTRVPFGTGAAVEKISRDDNSGNDLYDPRVFSILKKWLDLMNQSFSLSASRILDMARDIDPGLESFLTLRGFPLVWPKIRGNVKDQKTCERQFHGWFDGFETLKLVNFLTREFYPKVSMISALKNILEMSDMKYSGSLPAGDIPKTENAVSILSYLRMHT
ncbi:MAG: hypothetical protein CVU51_01490 [Deltaproteobacteria bacterium HGW-Deltaproteobacteria-1]|jgi:glycosyltransferase involved in cell wall biosynthesis|nr:MAG: hypothetical protein CVU51_01490 [Deltaproteobacteria bacterium HGW-Deltaproteobacteria-1]